MTLETTELQAQILRFRRIIQSKGFSFPALIHFPLPRNSFTLCKMKSVNGEEVCCQKSQNLISWYPEISQYLQLQLRVAIQPKPSFDQIS